MKNIFSICCLFFVLPMGFAMLILKFFKVLEEIKCWFGVSMVIFSCWTFKLTFYNNNACFSCYTYLAYLSLTTIIISFIIIIITTYNWRYSVCVSAWDFIIKVDQFDFKVIWWYFFVVAIALKKLRNDN